jgi:iron complex transport system substrate-binding protein
VSPKPLVRLLAGLVVGILLAACSRDRSREGRAAPGAIFPIEVRDDRGRLVTVRAEPQRIVSLLPSHTETLFALGLGSRVVGVDDFSDDPIEATRLPKLGGLYDAHVEQLLTLHPDLVLMSEWSSAVGPLEQAGVSAWAGSAQSFDDIFRIIETVGKMVGRTTEAAALVARMTAGVAAVEQHLRKSDRVRVYYELDRTPYTVGPSSFVGVLLAKAGGENVIPAGLGDYPKISPEVVVLGNPSIILGASLADASTRSGWSQIDAVRNGRVYKLPETESRLVVRPGPRMVEGLRVLAHRIHPEVDL